MHFIPYHGLRNNINDWLIHTNVYSIWNIDSSSLSLSLLLLYYTFYYFLLSIDWLHLARSLIRFVLSHSFATKSAIARTIQSLYPSILSSEHFCHCFSHLLTTLFELLCSTLSLFLSTNQKNWLFLSVLIHLFMHGQFICCDSYSRAVWICNFSLSHLSVVRICVRSHAHEIVERTIAISFQWC